MSNFELRGQASQLKQDNLALDIKAGAVVRSIKYLLGTACITAPIEEVDVEGIASLISELIEIKGDKIRHMATLKRIEQELN
jgi:hypothetical protein